MKLPRLNAIVDVDVARRAGWEPLDLVIAYLAGGARFLQLRAKSLSGSEFLKLSTEVVRVAHDAGAIVVVNDRADVARLSAADGVHVGQEDLSASAVRTLVGADAIVGFSTHTSEQIDVAVDEPVTYVAVGPVFGTGTKQTGYSAVSLDLVDYAAGKSGRRGLLPVVAIGGITLETAASVLRAGAASVAVITDLLATADPEARVRAYIGRLADEGMYNPR